MRAPSDCAAEKRSTEERNSCLLPCRISCTQAFMSRPVRWKTCLHVNEGGVEGGAREPAVEERDRGWGTQGGRDQKGVPHARPVLH